MKDSNGNNLYFGKYRATVLDNNDPQKRARLILRVPDVFGKKNQSSWAECSQALSGPVGSEMGSYIVPSKETAVWVEFEQGNSDDPVWTGCRWDNKSVLPEAAIEPSDLLRAKNKSIIKSPNIVFQSKAKNSFVITDKKDKSGGLVLKSAEGKSSIIINDHGIYITSGNTSIVLEDGKVSINDKALVIT